MSWATEEKQNLTDPLSNKLHFSLCICGSVQLRGLNSARLGPGDNSYSSVLHVFVAGRSPQHILLMAVAKVTRQTQTYQHFSNVHPDPPPSDVQEAKVNPILKL